MIPPCPPRFPSPFVLIVAALLFGAPAPLPAAVQWLWSGAPTPSSIRIKAKVTGDAAVTLEVGRDARLADARQITAVATHPAGDAAVLDFVVDELVPDTAYLYRVGDAWGRFRTLPEGPSSFTIALGSCAETGSTHPVFTTIARHEPLFFLQVGDLHYEDIPINDVAVFRRAYDRVLTSVTQAALYRSTPIVYVWDDHDFGPNNSDSTSPSRSASRLAYRETVPHYPLAVPTSDGPIHHAFTVGRVRFILTDLRSERMPPSVADSLEKTMMGAAQKAWLKAELLEARDHHALAVWVNTVPWIGDDAASESEDRWTGFTHERAELANFIADHGINNLCVISGDAHMLAIDDGRNNRYAADGPRGFPIFQAAALDRKGSVKGGPYSHGAFPGGGQFGLMRVIDDGGSEIHVEWSGRNFRDEEVVSYRFTVGGTSSRSE